MATELLLFMSGPADGHVVSVECGLVEQGEQVFATPMLEQPTRIELLTDSAEDSACYERVGDLLLFMGYAA